MTGVGRPRSEAPKRADNTGTISWLTNKQRWRVRAPDGRERLFKKDQEDEARVHLATFDPTRPSQVLTIGELVQLWFEKRNARWAPGRRGNLRSQIKRTIVDHPIGRIRVDRIMPDDLEAWSRDMAVGRTAATVRTYRSSLDTALTWGHQRKLVPHHPGRGEDPEITKPPVIKTWLSLDEANRLIQACSREHEPWGPLFVTCALLGLRPGEAAGIERGAFDLGAGTVSIRAGVQRDGGRAEALGETKTKRTRLLRVPPEVLDALARQGANQDLARMVYADVWSDQWGEMLFLNAQPGRNARAGVPPNEMTLRRHLTRICAEAGIPRVTPYELRHSCASIMLHKGIDPERVATLLGTSKAMLRHHYGHLIDPVLHEAATVWDDVLDRNGG